MVKIFPFFDCPGDTLSFICAINSNTEDLLLTWTIHLLSGEILTLTYNTSSLIESMDRLDRNINATLTDYNYANGSIESTLQFTQLKNVVMNGTIVECAIHGLDSEMIPVLINTSGM